MYKINMVNKISAQGLSQLDEALYTCGENIAQADAILVRSGDLHSIAIEPSLKCVGRAGAGVNNIPIDAMSEKGVVVFNTPGANANAVKELALCALLLSSRKVNEGIEWTKTLKGKGDEVAKLVEKGKGAFVGPELMGKKFGILGLGAIGGPLANAATHLGMEVYGHDPYMSVESAWGLSRNVIKAKDLAELFSICDYVSIHVPMNKETKGFINKANITQMKEGIRIINLARGELVDDNDMLDALESGHVASYVTDFPNDVIIGGKNVITIPHLGASTPESEENCAHMVVEQVSRYLESGVIKNSVNFPDVELLKYTNYRVCIIHKNVPTMVSAISGLFAKRNINIEEMQNRSKKDMAYTVIDTEADVSEEIVKEIESLENIVSVRVLN